jgi:predicted ABC-type ATPase
VDEDKQLWVLAGGNGALKPLDLPFINADILAKELYPDAPEAHSYDAAKIAEKMRLTLLQEGRSFCFETVFSHPSKIDFIATARALGYNIVLVFIHLETVDLNQARIAQRVSEGGHNVPADKVINRIPRLLDNIKSALPLCDNVYLLDNSRFDIPFLQVATIRGQQLTLITEHLPDWAEYLLAD